MVDHAIGYPYSSGLADHNMEDIDDFLAVCDIASDTAFGSSTVLMIYWQSHVKNMTKVWST